MAKRMRMLTTGALVKRVRCKCDRAFCYREAYVQWSMILLGQFCFPNKSKTFFLLSFCNVSLDLEKEGEN